MHKFSLYEAQIPRIKRNAGGQLAEMALAILRIINLALLLLKAVCFGMETFVNK